MRRHLPLVRFLLDKMQRRGELTTDVEFEDLIAVGNWAIWEALRRWEPDKGAQSTYLTSYIWGYVMKYQRDATKAVGWHRTEGRLASVVSFNQPVAGAEDLTIGDSLQAPDDTEDAAYWAAELATLQRAAENLPLANRAVVRALIEDRPVSHVAAELGLPKHRVQQVKAQTLEHLAALRGVLPSP